MVFGALIEYACVGYTDKRIQLRKNRFLALQKLMEEKRQEMEKQMELKSLEVQDSSYQNGYNRKNSIRTPKNERFQREVSFTTH